MDASDLGHENFLEFCREQTRLTDGIVVERDGVLMLAGPRAEATALDIAARVDPTVPAADVVAAAIGHYGGLGHGFMLYTRADSEADLARAARSAGLVPLLQTPEMICSERPADPVALEGVDVRPASSVEDVQRFAEIMAAGYADTGLSRAEALLRFRLPERWLAPHVTLFLGWLHGDPVAGGLTFVGSRSAGVYLLATVPAARGRGIGNAVVTRMTQAGFDADSPCVGLQATRTAEAMYRRLGYEAVYLYHGYYWSPPETPKEPPARR